MKLGVAGGNIAAVFLLDQLVRAVDVVDVPAARGEPRYSPWELRPRKAYRRGRPHSLRVDLNSSAEVLGKMSYDAIVMAQVSIRALLPDLKDVKTPLLCSFFSGYGAIADKLNEIAAQD